ncbi:hypothetical protein HY091_01280 [Candidatus Kaiserbacteria bacterium]|nr:hypothetical protein [Candidatus Kaiserbacteria bacterium]
MRILDDIIPPSRRPVPETAGTPPPAGAPPRLLGPRRRLPLRTVGVVVVIIVLCVVGLFYFSGAKVEITPVSLAATAHGTFKATAGSGDLSFLVISAKKVATESVAGSGTKTVNTSASGTLTVYNTQGKAQRLIANTRFATAAGLVFRIHTSISVPAGSMSAPGNIQVTVYADQPGASYNIEPASFTLPGLSGTLQASEVYAKSLAPFTGGASGLVPIIDPATENAATNALMNALALDLATSIKSQVPKGYVLLPGAATSTYQELAAVPSATTGKVDVKEQGTITAVVFPAAALAKAIASAAGASGYQGEPVTFISTDALSANLGAGVPDSSAALLAFSLSGSAPLVYTVDPGRIASAIAGKTRSAAEVALSSYPEVKRAVLILRPFWRQTFPEDPSAITVVVGSL